MKYNREEEILKVLSIIKETSMQDFKDLASTNCGSNHKTKDEIVNKVCAYSQDALNLQNRLHQALDYIINYGTFDEWFQSATDRANRDKQPKQDKEQSLKELMRISEIMITI